MIPETGFEVCAVFPNGQSHAVECGCREKSGCKYPGGRVHGMWEKELSSEQGAPLCICGHLPAARGGDAAGGKAGTR